MGAAGGSRPPTRRRGHCLHRVRRRCLQPLRDPLRPRQGDPQLRAAVPGHKQAYVDAGIDVHYDADVTGVDVRARSSRSPARARSAGTGWCSGPASTTPTRACRAAISGALLREEHPRGHGVGQGSRRVKSAVVLEPSPRTRDGYGARPPGHRDAPGRPQPVGDVGGGRPRHHGPGRGIVGRDGREDTLQHAAGGVRGRRFGSGPSRPPRGSSTPISG